MCRQQAADLIPQADQNKDNYIGKEPLWRLPVIRLTALQVRLLSETEKPYQAGICRKLLRNV